MRFNNDDTDGRTNRNGRERGVTRRRVIRGGAAGLAAAVSSAGVATANHNDGDSGPVRDLFSQQKAGWSSEWTAAKAALGRMFADADKRTAKQSAAQTKKIWNENSSVIVDYANARLDDSRDKKTLSTIRLEWIKDGERVERYIVADVNSSNEFASAKIADSTSRSIDYWVEMKRLAADRTPDELEFFVDEYAKPNEALDNQYTSRLAGRYGPDVDTNLPIDP